MAQGMNSNYWLETVTPLGASATFTGAARDSYGSGGGSASNPASASQWGYFSAVVNANQTGTVTLQGAQSSSGPWYPVATGSLVANVPLYLYTPICFQWFQVVVVNGTSAQGNMNVCTSFTSQ